MSKILTLAQLVEHGACESQRENFKRLFGEQVEVSVELASLLGVAEARFDFDWAADVFFTTEERDQYYVELRNRRAALKNELGLVWWTDVPKEKRLSLEPVLWAEFYLKSEKSVEQPKVEETQVTETPIEESLGGY